MKIYYFWNFFVSNGNQLSDLKYPSERFFPEDYWEFEMKTFLELDE